MGTQPRGVTGFLSDEVEDYISVLDRDSESDEEDTRAGVDRMVRVATSSLEGFAQPWIEKLLRLFKETPETWRWMADDFYTREVIAGIPGMVNRFLRLTPVLAGVVPSKEVNVYLREATRCFIYGFFQASIALCRAALEAGLNHHLERKLGAVPVMDLAEKIDEAARFKLVPPQAASLAHGVRIAGRNVLHRRPAKANHAFDALVQARGFLMELYQR